MESSLFEVAPSKKEIVIASVPLLVVCAVALVFFLIARGGELETRIMEIYSVDGQDVSLTGSALGAVTVSAGLRLYDGYGIFTGKNTICHIRLDSDSLIRMDSLSRILVNRATSTDLSITLEDGQVLINIQNQYPGHKTEIAVGDFTITISDANALFIAGRRWGFEYAIVLDGTVYVYDGLVVVVTAGHVIGRRFGESFETTRVIVEYLDSFAWQAILDLQERVLEAGAISVEDLEWIFQRMSLPDYVWIQGVQISTAITALYIISYEHRFSSKDAIVYRMRLTDEDIVPLSNMMSLTRLTLIGHSITDISPLAELTGLRWLSLENNQISDISSLAELTSLEELCLRRNQISDLSPIAGLTNLESLWLDDSEISDITPLAGLTNINRLGLSDNQISDITPLAELTNLESLFLCSNETGDLSPLAGLTGLTRLGLSDNQISDISPLAGLTGLIRLEIRHNQISDISPLTGLASLRNLYLAENQISDISPLAGLTNLAFLNLSRNQINDLSHLSGLNGLIRLNIQNNHISDISPLAGLANLTQLRLGFNEISDISPLVRLNRLRLLELELNQISDISPLAGLASLENLYLAGNLITDWSSVDHVESVGGRT